MITQKEWMEISLALEDHHALFYELWHMGRPCFTDDIETAAVRFAAEGEFIEFVFNPDYWNSLTVYERLFVISHECLHVVLNHGVRTTRHNDAPRINTALDIVVNHLLVNSFGFDRTRIRDEDVLCWTDTVFKNDPKVAEIPTNESYEYYFQKIPESMVIEVYTIDDHSMMRGEVDKIIGKLNDRLTSEEKNSIKDVIKKHFVQESDTNDERGGSGCGGWSFIKVEPVAQKRKWESVILKWSLKYMRDGLDEHEQWAKMARRFELLPQDIFLPSEMEDDSKDFDRIPIHLYMDTSGSCIRYKERFFRAALSLPKDRFVVRLFCFDTRVEETTLASKKIYGGGGTAFDIIERNIQTVIKTEKSAYPEGVFLITDGKGSPVIPQFPERWHWFMTRNASSTYVPNKSKTYKLDNFE
jgi:predicted metal-dependent peptidase